MGRGLVLVALTALMWCPAVWGVNKAFTNPEMLAQVEHDTEEFHRASTEQLALKQQYIELLEAMGVPVTEELTHNQGRRRLLARARGELEEQSFDSYPAPLVAAATLVDALKTRLAAYDEYIGNKAQVAALARLYQATSPSFRMEMGTCTVTEKGGCFESTSLQVTPEQPDASHCMWVVLKDVKLSTLDWSMELSDGSSACPDYGASMDEHSCLFSLVINGKVYTQGSTSSSAHGRPDGVFVEANSRIDLYVDQKVNYRGRFKVCDSATDLVHAQGDTLF